MQSFRVPDTIIINAWHRGHEFVGAVVLRFGSMWIRLRFWHPPTIPQLCHHGPVSPIIEPILPIYRGLKDAHDLVTLFPLALNLLFSY